MFPKTLRLIALPALVCLLPAGQAAGGYVDDVTVRAVVESLVNLHGAEHETRFRRGVTQVADRWWSEDGTTEVFGQFCVQRFIPDGAQLERTFLRLQDVIEQVDGHHLLVQEFVDGEWQFVEGVSDVDRTERQQTLMFAMLASLKTMRSPTALTGIAGSFGDTIVLSESLSMGDAVAMAWELRSMSSSSIRRIVVPTEPVATADGSFALRATVPFRELLEG